MWMGRMLRALRESELELATELRRTGERHGVDGEIPEIAEGLAVQCEVRAARLVPLAGRYGEDLGGRYETGVLRGVLQTVQHMQSELVERTSGAGLHQLRDLRTLYLAACEVEITWALIENAARSAADDELAGVAAHGHEETAAQAIWLRERLVEAAPDALAAG
jgi:hypothetical protein